MVLKSGVEKEKLRQRLRDGLITLRQKMHINRKRNNSAIKGNL